MNIQAVLATAALTVAFVPGVQAGVVLPDLYAREYCSFRSLGVSEDEAIAAAVDASYVDNGDYQGLVIDYQAVKVTIDGEQYDSDIISALQAANDRCPQYN
jgi:hypothetical protein